MSSQKTIVVLGSTGLQGGSVVRSLLEDGTFRVRAITRNADSNAAKHLRSLNVEVVTADLEDVNSLRTAFRGAYGVFGVTDFWNLYPKHHEDGPATQIHEEKHGQHLVDAAEAEGIEHFVWSTLHHSEKVPTPHFESKFNVDQYLKSKNLRRTSVYTSVYYSALLMFKWIEKEDDGFVLKIPIFRGARIPSFNVNDLGSWVLPAFKNPQEWVGKDIHAYGENLTVDDYLNTLRRVTGKKIRLEQVTKEQFWSPEFHDKLGDEMFMNQRSFAEDQTLQDMELSHKVNPKAETFEDYVRNDPELKEFMGY